MNLITQPKEIIAEFVINKINSTMPISHYSALAMIDDKGIAVGVIYDWFTPRKDGFYQDCRMHVAAREGARWATRAFLRAAFDYPFNQLGCKRVTGVVPRKAKKVRKFDEHLGFKFEACIKQAIENDDIIVYRMMKEDCRWI